MANIKVSDLISKKSLEEQAVDTMTLRKTAPEFGKLIYVFKALRVITQMVSVASGFCFFYYKLHSFISGFVGADVLSAILAIGLLVTIEGIVQYSIEKAGKMGFLNQWKWMGGMAAIAVVFFTISFYISTQGIWLAASDTTTKNIDIEQSFRDEKAAIKANYGQRISDIKEDISKMATWRGKLSASQQEELGKKRAQIESLYSDEKAELQALDNRRENELSKIKNEAVTSASDYYTYVAVILVFELMTNFLVVFFYHHIMHDEQPKLSVEQEYKAYYDLAAVNARKTYMAIAAQQQRNYAMLTAELMTQQGLKFQPVSVPVGTPGLATAASATQPEPSAPPASSQPPCMAAQPAASEEPAPTSAPSPQPEKTPAPAKRRPGFLPDPDGPINDNGIPLSAPIEVPMSEPLSVPAPSEPGAMFGVTESVPASVPEVSVPASATDPYSTLQSASEASVPASVPQSVPLTPSLAAHSIYEPRICPFCNESFMPKTYNQRFCCVSHKNAFHKKEGVPLEQIKLRNSNR